MINANDFCSLEILTAIAILKTRISGWELKLIYFNGFSAYNCSVMKLQCWSCVHIFKLISECYDEILTAMLHTNNLPIPNARVKYLYRMFEQKEDKDKLCLIIWRCHSSPEIYFWFRKGCFFCARMWMLCSSLIFMRCLLNDFGMTPVVEKINGIICTFFRFQIISISIVCPAYFTTNKVNFALISWNVMSGLLSMTAMSVCKVRSHCSL